MAGDREIGCFAGYSGKRALRERSGCSDPGIGSTQVGPWNRTQEIGAKKVELEILDLVIAGLTIDSIVNERQGDVPAHLPYVPIVTRGEASIQARSGFAGA